MIDPKNSTDVLPSITNWLPDEGFVPKRCNKCFFLQVTQCAGVNLRV